MGMEATIEAVPTLVINADDFGYRPAYDTGIVLVARAGAIDRVSVMATRRCDPAPLLELGIAVGLHLESDLGLAAQLRAFEDLTGRLPVHIDGHRHCHAEARMAADVARMAAELAVPVRAVSPSHRAHLRAAGVATTDRLVGRLFEHQPALPIEIARWSTGERAPSGTTEWFVHPGFRDPESGSPATTPDAQRTWRCCWSSAIASAGAASASSARRSSRAPSSWKRATCASRRACVASPSPAARSRPARPATPRGHRQARRGREARRSRRSGRSRRCRRSS